MIVTGAPAAPLAMVGSTVRPTAASWARTGDAPAQRSTASSAGNRV